MSLGNWFFDQLPSYFKDQDSYKDNNNRGLLERFLEIFSLELDEEVIEKAETYTNQLEPLLCDEKFLKHLAYTLGRPPNFFSTISEYRRFLAFVLSVYKIKGTEKCYEVVFGYLGYLISLEVTSNSCNLYDDSLLYDDGNLYDTCCAACSPYTISLSEQGAPLLPSSTLYTWDASSTLIATELLKRILCFLEPIDLRMDELIPGLFASENWKATPSDNVYGALLVPQLYDDGHIYDNSLTYDTFTTTSFTIYP